MAQEVMTVQGSDTIAKRLLLEQLRAFRRFVHSIADRVRRECALKRVPYLGIASWPLSLREWYDRKIAELRAKD